MVPHSTFAVVSIPLGSTAPLKVKGTGTMALWMVSSSGPAAIAKK